jgi:hypothetical protein
MQLSAPQHLFTETSWYAGTGVRCLISIISSIIIPLRGNKLYTELIG